METSIMNMIEIYKYIIHFIGKDYSLYIRIIFSAIKITIVSYVY